MNLTDMIIPIFIAVVVIYGLYKKVDVFDAFTEGAKNGLKTGVEILPSLLALIVSVGMLTNSGFISDFTNFLSPITTRMGFPEKCVSLIVLKPVSGSASTAILNDILINNHPDGLTGRVASVIAGATETTFYTVALYFGSAKLIGSKRILTSALLADVTGFIFACVTVKLLFY